MSVYVFVRLYVSECIYVCAYVLVGGHVRFGPSHLCCLGSSVVEHSV